MMKKFKHMLGVAFLVVGLGNLAYGQDAKLTALTETTAPAGTDLLYVVIDPAGTPLSRKATISNVVKQAVASGIDTIVFLEHDTPPACAAGDYFIYADLSETIFKKCVNGVLGDIPSGSGTATGTNTGDQTITLTGDVTGSGTGSFAATIAANVVGPPEIDETADYDFTGLLTAPIAIASLPAAGTAGRLRWVNNSQDGSPSCAATGGTTLVLCYDDGVNWIPLNPAVVTPTLSQVMSQGNSYFSATSPTTGLQIGKDANNHWVMYWDETTGPKLVPMCAGVLNNCNKIFNLNSTYKFEIQDSGGVPLFRVTEGTGTTRLVDGTQAQGDVLYYNGTKWTQLAAGTDGQALKTQGTGANPAWTFGLATLVRKTANEACDNTCDTTLQADDHLTFSVVANGIYTGRISVLYDGGTTGDIKFDFSVPAGASGTYTIICANTGFTALQQPSQALTAVTVCGANGVGTTVAANFDIAVVNGANAGSVTLRFAKNASQAGVDTSVLTNSAVTIYRVQ